MVSANPAEPGIDRKKAGAAQMAELFAANLGTFGRLQIHVNRTPCRLPKYFALLFRISGPI